MAAFATGPGQSWVVSVFVDSILEATGLSRVGVSVLYAIATGLGALGAVVAGRLSDRHGPRALLLAAAAGLGVACFAMAAARGGLSALLGFVGLRALGQGAMPVGVVLLVASWFVRTRGRAMALVSLGYAASGAVLPPAARALIDAVGWRAAYVVLGVMVWMLVLPATILAVRDGPGDLGPSPDGTAEPGEPEPVAPSRRGVLATSAFWMLALPLAVPPLILTALFFHQSALFAARGLSAVAAAGAFVPYAVASVPAMLLAGAVADRTGPRAVVVGNLLALVLALVGVTLIEGPRSGVAYAAILGLSGGIHPVAVGVTWAHFYGRHDLGQVQGPAAMVMAVGAALGPLPLAVAHRLTGGYGAGIACLVVLSAAGAVTAALARPPRRG